MTNEAGTLLDAEKTIRDAVARLEAALADIERFGAASQTLQELAARQKEVSGKLHSAGQLLVEGATLLQQQGISGLQKELGETRTEIVGLLDEARALEVSSNEQGITTLRNELGRVESSLRRAIEGTQNAISTLQKSVDGELRMLKSRSRWILGAVTMFGILGTALLALIFLRVSGNL
jgi:hypothetical protein